MHNGVVYLEDVESLIEATPRVQALDDSLLLAYNESLKEIKNDAAVKNLGQFLSHEGQLAGSSPFMNLHLRRFLPSRCSLITKEDHCLVLRKNPAFLEGSVVEHGIYLVTAGDSYEPNQALAVKLADSLNSRGISLGNGVFIPYSALEQDVDSSGISSYGLVWTLNDQAKEVIVPLNETNGDYRKEGLSRACQRYQHGGETWSLGQRNLEETPYTGRVVVKLKGFNSDSALDFKRRITESARNYANSLNDVIAQAQAELERLSK